MLRYTRSLVLVLAVAAVPLAAQQPDTLPLSIAPAAVVPSTLHEAPPALTPAVRAALPSHPVPTTRFPVELMGLAALATARSKTRRSAGKKRDVQMLVDSDIHVIRKDEDKKSYTHVVRGGVLLDDLEDAKLAAEQAGEVAQLQADHATELAAAPEDQKAKVQQRQETALVKLQAKHAAALNDVGT
jgi:F0F1-type ATP synthase epsilon subunit